MTPIIELQRQLEDTYEVTIPFAATDFITHNEALVAQAEPAESVPAESLLVAQDDEDLEIALYLHRDVLTHLKADCPLDRLHGGNLQSFCHAAEGVSHFVYLIWRAARDVQVSCVELELQAEVDKFVCAWALLARQSDSETRASLRHTLFERVRYADALTPEQRSRYEEANRLASKYCRHLDHQYLRRGQVNDFLAEIRRFYRLPHPRKQQYVQNMMA